MQTNHSGIIDDYYTAAEAAAKRLKETYGVTFVIGSFGKGHTPSLTWDEFRSDKRSKTGKRWIKTHWLGPSKDPDWIFERGERLLKRMGGSKK